MNPEAELIQLREEVEALRRELAGLTGENMGLSVTAGFLEKRCDVLEAAAVRKLTMKEQDEMKGCCPLCGVTLMEHLEESGRMVRARAERDVINFLYRQGYGAAVPAIQKHFTSCRKEQP